MTGFDLMKHLLKLSDKDLDKQVAFPSGEYLGAMKLVRSVTIIRPANAEGPDRIYLQGGKS
jgi:hypothetical protein